MTPGAKIVTMYFFLSYFVPMVGYYFFQQHITSIYKQTPLTLYSMFFIISLYVVFVMLTYLRLPRLPSLNIDSLVERLYKLGRIYIRLRLPFAIISIVVSILSFLLGENASRYETPNILQMASPLVIPMLTIRAIVTADLFYTIFVRQQDNVKIVSRHSIETILLALSLTISTEGTVSTLTALVAMFFALFPGIFQRMVFINRNSDPLKDAIRSFFLGLSLLIIFFSAVEIGSWIKASPNQQTTIEIGNPFNELTRTVSDTESAKNFTYRIIEAQAIDYHSYLFTLKSSYNELRQGEISPIIHPLRTLVYRFDVLTGNLLNISRSEPQSISQHNYFTLTTEPIKSHRQGSSPGLLGSFNYMFPLPLNFIMCIAYLLWLVHILNSGLYKSRGKSLSFFGCLIILEAFLVVFFQSPFDLVNVIDNAAIYVILIVCILISQQYRVKNAGDPQLI